MNYFRRRFGPDTAIVVNHDKVFAFWMIAYGKFDFRKFSLQTLSSIYCSNGE